MLIGLMASSQAVAFTACDSGESLLSSKFHISGAMARSASVSELMPILDYLGIIETFRGYIEVTPLSHNGTNVANDFKEKLSFHGIPESVIILNKPVEPVKLISTFIEYRDKNEHVIVDVFKLNREETGDFFESKFFEFPLDYENIRRYDCFINDFVGSFRVKE